MQQCHQCIETQTGSSALLKAWHADHGFSSYQSSNVQIPTCSPSTAPPRLQLIEYEYKYDSNQNRPAALL